MSEEYRRRAAGFRALHDADRPLLLPNAWDYATAAALLAAGFPAIGTTSLGVTAAAGLPDGAGAGRAETVALARRLGRLPCPVTVDIEGGLGGGPDEVADLAAELAGAGIVGINLEDGRANTTLADADEHAGLVAAVKRRVPDMFVNARVDTHWLAVLGASDPPDQAETLRRARRYVAAGADGVFVPGLVEADRIAELVREIPAPLNILLLPGRISLAGLAELGVRRVSTGSLLFRAALRATVDAATAARDGEPIPGQVPSYAAVEELISSR